MCVFFFQQKTAYEMRISDWSSDVCSSSLAQGQVGTAAAPPVDASLMAAFGLSALVFKISEADLHCQRRVCKQMGGSLDQVAHIYAMPAVVVLVEICQKFAPSRTRLISWMTLHPAMSAGTDRKSTRMNSSH